MTINEFKAHIKFLGYKKTEVYYCDIFNNNYTEICIFIDKHSIRIDSLINEKSLFISLYNPNIIERVINFDKLGTILPK